jgi:putative ABC transport system permease protein
VTALTIRGLTARKLRATLTALAIFFGVAMIAGTLMLTDTINSSFDDIFQSANARTDVTVKPRETVEDSRGGEPPALDAAVLPRVLAVDGVAEAAGSIFDASIAILGDDGKRIGPHGPPHLAAGTVPPRFNPWTYVLGRAPRNPDEVAIDNFTTKEEKYRIGERVRIAGTSGVKAYTIVGVGRFGSDIPLGGASIALFTPAEAQRLTGKVGRFDEILVAADPGVSPAALKARIAAKMPPSVTVRTGEETAAADSQNVKEGFSFLSTALLIFGGIALFVGSFLIFNTFSITVSQRTREFGMLRTLGASGRQVLATVMLEALLIGLVGSLVGIAGGIGFVAMITALFKALGFDLPTSGLVISAGTIVVGLAVGLISTAIASILPALRATRVTPLEALRDPGSPIRARPRPWRTALATGVTLLGAALILLGLFGTDSAGAAFQLMGAGLLALFIGVAMLSNRLVRPLATVIGWPIERLRGVTGELARENTLRNPSRTTTTAAALMIGLALVTFVATFASALNKSFDEALDKTFVGDLALVNTDGFSRIPAKVADEVRNVPGVAAVSPLASGNGNIAGVGKQTINAIDPETVSRVAKIDWVHGSNATLAQLGEDGAIVESSFGEDHGIDEGDAVQVTTPTGKRATYFVRGSARDKPKLLFNSITISRATFARDFAVTSDDVDLVKFAPGASFAAARHRIDAALARVFPNVESRSQKELKEDQRKQINQLLVLIYALLALSVVISLFGVVNTLVLTIHERTREIGMLRAIGTSRSQVRRMIRYESVITAMIGAIIGAALGLVLAIVAVKALEDEGFVLSIPYPLLIVMLLLAAIAGVAAAVAPARRAARIQVMEALQYE